MTGPGLSRREAHHAIHQAAFAEAEQLTLLLRRALRSGDREGALQVAAVLIEHWQACTLRHAEAEESGWYREIIAERPELRDDVLGLTRDHELMRLLLAEVQGILSARGIASGVVERFEAMLLVNGIHSREEERCLLGEERVAETPDDGGETREAVPPGGLLATAATGVYGNALAAPVPLAVARPAVHAQLVGLLRQRGLTPVDLLVDLRADAAGQAVLHVAYGADYAQAMEWPLEAAMTTEAMDATLKRIVEECERAAKADYHTRMQTPR